MSIEKKLEGLGEKPIQSNRFSNFIRKNLSYVLVGSTILLTIVGILSKKTYNKD